MKRLEIETQREHKIQGLSSNNFLEIEDPRDLVVSGEQKNLNIEQKTVRLLIVIEVNIKVHLAEQRYL